MYARNASVFMRRMSFCKIFTRDFNFTLQLLDVQVKMPSLSPTMTTGTIVKWLKKEGETVASGDVLCEIQTDKAVVAMEMDEEGVLAKILVPENTPDIEVGSLIAIMAEEGVDWRQVKVPTTVKVAREEPKIVEATTEASPVPVKESPQYGHRTSRIIGPSVKLLLSAYNLNAKEVAASGPFGTLLKGDVLKHVNAKKLSPAKSTAAQQHVSKPVPAVDKPSSKAPTPSKPSIPSIPGTAFEDIPLSNMRKTIAKRLTQSKMTVPHAYSRASVNMASALAFRKQLKSDGIVISVNDIIVKASASALREVSEVNVQFSDGTVKRVNTIDVSVAVATESGLITPIVHNADQLGILSISARIKELADKAKANKLQLHEFQGGSFSVSNLGMFGIDHFTAIINPPQAAILAVGGTSKNLISNFSVDERMQVTLCYDNRAIGDDDAARWLNAFQTAMEDCSTMLLGLNSTSASKLEAFL